MLGEIKADIKNMSDTQDSMNSNFSKLGDRVTALEMFKSNLAGKIVVVMAVGTFLINVIWEWAKKKINI